MCLGGVQIILLFGSPRKLGMSSFLIVIQTPAERSNEGNAILFEHNSLLMEMVSSECNGRS